MQLKCPSCNAGFSLEAALGIEAARGALLVALQMPAPLHRPLVQYLGMFRAPGRALAFDRVEKLLGELLPALEKQTVTRNGLTRACPVALWQAGFERMVDQRDNGKLQLPLKSHGYLLEIVAALADQAGAKEEKAQEASVRSGSARADGDKKLERLQVISQARGEIDLGLLSREEAKQRLREAGINPEVLDG
jgi:hypothetical protein